MGLRDYYYGMTLGGFVYDRPDPEWVNPVKKKLEAQVERALARDKMVDAAYRYDRAIGGPSYVDYRKVAEESKRRMEDPYKVLHDIYHVGRWSNPTKGCPFCTLDKK